MSIWITGDCHQDFTKFTSYDFPQGKELTKDDYVIIAGDVGIFWAKELDKNESYWIKWLEEKPWTTLFVLGNHENYDRWELIPEEEWNGGFVQKISSSVIRLKNGEIYNIDGHKILTMGGAASHDIHHGIIDPADYSSREEMEVACRKLEEEHGGWRYTFYRIKGESWWPQEVPNTFERTNCIINLLQNDFKVDFIVSHEAPSSDVILLSGGSFKPHEYSVWLENEVRSKTEYKKWFFGHYHLNKRITDKEECLYHSIIRIV